MLHSLSGVRRPARERLEEPATELFILPVADETSPSAHQHHSCVRSVVVSKSRIQKSYVSAEVKQFRKTATLKHRNCHREGGFCGGGKSGSIASGGSGGGGIITATFTTRAAFEPANDATVEREIKG